MPEQLIKGFNHKKYGALNLGHCWMHNSRILFRTKISFGFFASFATVYEQNGSKSEWPENRGRANVRNKSNRIKRQQKKKKKFVKLIECNIQKRCFYFNYFLTTCGKMYHSLCLACWTSAFGTKQGTVGASQASVPGAQRADGIERHHAVGK